MKVIYEHVWCVFSSQHDCMSVHGWAGLYNVFSMFPSRPLCWGLYLAISSALCLRGGSGSRGRAGGDPRGASASRVKGKSDRRAVFVHIRTFKSFWWKHFEIALVHQSGCTGGDLCAPALYWDPLLHQRKNKHSVGVTREELWWKRWTEYERNEIFCERHRWRFHCMTWSLELFSVTKSQTIKENIWSNEINFNWNQIFKAALRNFLG